jgi:3-oxoacyl-[acyl-carrier-protein] synthase II
LAYNATEQGLHHSRNGDSPIRVVITGLGAVTPVGLTTEETWDALLAGKSGVTRISAFDPSELRAQIAGQVHDFEPTDYMDRKEARKLDRYIQFSVAAARQAASDADLHVDGSEQDRMGVIIGTGIGGISAILENVVIGEEKGLRRVSPFLIPNMLPDSASGKVAIELGLRGVNHAVISACATGTAAVGEAFEVIRRGQADAMFAGGAEAAILPLIVAGFDNMGALSRNNDDPARACRPFDLNRDGFVISEGGTVLVLESEHHALARGARIYAEVIGYGNSADAFNMVAPHEDAVAAVNAVRAALVTAAEYGVQPEDVDYINAHGTGTKLNDATETLAIKKALGERAYQVRVSGIKGMTGHLLGAAGALEALVCAKVIETGAIPATVNLTDPDPECDLDYTPRKVVDANVHVALSNSFGFGGHNACIAFRRYSGRNGI